MGGRNCGRDPRIGYDHYYLCDAVAFTSSHGWSKYPTMTRRLYVLSNPAASADRLKTTSIDSRSERRLAAASNRSHGRRPQTLVMAVHRPPGVRAHYRRRARLHRSARRTAEPGGRRRARCALRGDARFGGLDIGRIVKFAGPVAVLSELRQLILHLRTGERLIGRLGKHRGRREC